MKNSLLIALALLAFVSCPRKDGKAVARVDGSALTAEEVVLQIPADYRKMMTAADVENFLQSWAENEMLCLEARKRGIDREDSVKLLIDIYTKRILAEALKLREFNKITVTEDETRKYFEEHKDEFLHAVKVSQIVLASAEEAAKTLEEIKAGADFIKLAKTKSIVRDRNPTGITDYFTRGNYFPEIEEIVFAMKVGEISPVMPAPDGSFLIIKLLERRRVKDSVDYYEIRDYIQKSVLELARRREVLNTLMARIKTTYKVETMPDQFPR
jgi:peptidyl-prolyl cis-trans isomerase C